MKSLEIAQLLHKADRQAAPTIIEIQNIYNMFSKNGVALNSDKILYILGECNQLLKLKEVIKIYEKIIDLFFESFNKIWGVNYSRKNLDEFQKFLVHKFGPGNTLVKLIQDNMAWLVNPNNLIDVTREAFKNKGFDYSDYLKVPHNLTTFIEEFIIFSIKEFLDKRLIIHEIQESMRDKSAPTKFKIAVKPGVDLNEFKGHPKFDVIYKTGYRLYGLKDKIREKKYGKVKPIIHSQYQGKEAIVVGGNRVFIGNWKTFTDFLFYYIQETFGKEWWLNEESKAPESQSPVIGLANKKFDHEKKYSVAEDELHSTYPNGPMYAYLSLAYDLYILSDHRKLQNKLIERMKQPNKTNFWGARYEAIVAVVFIKAGFDIEYEDESDVSRKHPEFIAIHKETGEKIAVEAKRRNRQSLPKNESEIKLKITQRIGDAVKKYIGIPYVLFLELDLPPIKGDPMKQPWKQELINSSNKAGIRDKDGKDFINLIIFTNYPTEHPEDSTKYPSRSYIVSLSEVPKKQLKNPIHLDQIISVVDGCNKIPNWFED